MSGSRHRGYMKRSYRYAREYSISVDGAVHYHGPLFEFVGEDCPARFRRFAVQSGVIAALTVLCGAIPAASMRFSPFVVFPYGVDLVASFVLLVSCLRLVRIPQPMEHRSFDVSYGRLLPVSAVTAFASAVAFVGHVVFILTHLQLGVPWYEAVFGCAVGGACALSVLIFLGGRKIRFRSYES